MSRVTRKVNHAPKAGRGHVCECGARFQSARDLRKHIAAKQERS